ncbi:hypothetical protein [Polynucleobacter sp. UK-Mo-2m-Kol15]|uniref:hypothetical protein n=1 Tax=Polynucleobacter sp. UK-Mo-2m-Kol15 TaxID=2576916 RepID=UPI001C0DE52A|nr:hypothetical protein [Polynucleobacter sp. UK-Mo-2m-Kol15]
MQSYIPRVAQVFQPDSLHAAGPSPGGCSVVAVHDSKESWEKFLGDILLPTIQSQIKNGFTTEPQVTCFEVDHLQEP